MTGLDVEWHESLKLSAMEAIGLHKFTAEIEDICVSAVKEYGLENALGKMQEEWGETQFTLLEYRTSGTYIISAIDEIQQILDDQIVKTQAMRGSRSRNHLNACCGAPFLDARIPSFHRSADAFVLKSPPESSGKTACFCRSVSPPHP